MSRVIGTSRPDIIECPAGRSIVRALAGADTVIAAFEIVAPSSDFPFEDVDIVYLGPGNDFASGFLANDTIYGGSGDDTIETGDFSTWFSRSYGRFVRVYGEGGDDHLTGYGRLDGGKGDDTLTGGGRMIGREGDDVYEITRSLRHDIVDRQGKSVITIDIDIDIDIEREVFIGSGRDQPLRFITGDGRDIIELEHVFDCLIRTGDRGDTVTLMRSGGEVHAGNGNDFVKGATIAFGGNGHDTLDGVHRADGGRGGDEITDSGDNYNRYVGHVLGGGGNDTITSSHNVEGGNGADEIAYSRNVSGGAGNDTITSSHYVEGGAGADRILQSVNVNGGDGNDVIESARREARGEAGDDFVGGWGLLEGNDGDDTLEVQSNRRIDTLVGGSGDDELRFAFDEGDDVLRGEDGADTFVLNVFEPGAPPYLIETVATIEDFEQGIDKIDVSLAAPSLADLTIEQAGDFVLLKDEFDYVLVILEEQLATDFTADDFIF